MGNTLAKYRKADWVDGGRVREKILPDEQPIMTDSWGVPIYAPKEYDTHLVKKLIRQRRLAPFYDANEQTEDGDNNSSNDDSFSESSTTRKQRAKVKKYKRSKDDPEAEESSYFDVELLEKDLVDCPICLLAYPRNINYTECCRQAMCTSCFVKIKRPASGRVITCPYCNHLNFAVVYHKPRWLAELAKSEETRDEGIRPDPVACEAVKVNIAVHERIQQRLHAHQHRSQTQPRYYYAQAQRSASMNGPRRYVFYEPSGSYTFYDNQYYRAPASEEAAVMPPSRAQPTYYQHYQQQEYQRQQQLRARAEAYERSQLEEAIRRSMIESGENAEEYAAAHSTV